MTSGWIQEAIDGQLALKLLVVLLFLKIVAFACTVSSGGSAESSHPRCLSGRCLAELSLRCLTCRTVQE
jgi:H+/Cl- antiporter ClcA